jgi:hypothetical protein
MKSFVKLLTLVLCVEFIVSPIASTGIFLPSSGLANSCPAGLEWNSTLNRCLTSQQTSEIMNAAAQCAPNDSACFKMRAQEAFQNQVNRGKAPQAVETSGFQKFSSNVANIGAVVVPLSIAIGGMKELKSTCASISFYSMIAGSVSLIAGDLLANMGHKSRLDKIKASWGSIVNPEHVGNDKDKQRQASIDAQSKAFGKLAEAEESLAKAAKMKQTFFTVAGAAYTAATAIAIVEIFNPTDKVKTWCPGKDTGTTSTGTTSAGTTSAGTTSAGTTSAGTTSAGAGTGDLSTEKDAPRFIIPNGKPGSLITPENEIRQKRWNYQNPMEAPIAKQFKHNILQSKDLAQLIINTKASKETLSSPSLTEYEGLKKALDEEGFKDPEVLNIFKSVTLMIFEKISPIQSALALEQDPEARSQQIGTSGREETPVNSGPNYNSAQGAGGSGGTQIGTNAAKSYKEMDAQGARWGQLITGAALGVGIGLIAKGKIAAKMVTPKGRAILSGIMATLSFTMAKHAKDQARASEERATLLKNMQTEFNSASGSIFVCKSEDRTDPAKPNCYCYTAEGQRNTARTNSQVCQKIWNQKFARAGNYLSNPDQAKTCVQNNRRPDPECKCRQTKTCLSITVPNIRGLNVGTVGMINSGLETMNSLNNGSISSAEVNTVGLENKAARIQDLIKNLENKKELSDYKKEKDKETASLMQDLSRAAASLPASQSVPQSDLGSLPSNPAEAARELEKELENIPDGNSSSGSNQIALPSNAPGEEEKLDFGQQVGDPPTSESQLAEAMKQNLDYGTNDINKGSTSNIFEVLSNRYQRSGMRRLFDEEGKTKADEAGKSDISE